MARPTRAPQERVDDLDEFALLLESRGGDDAEPPRHGRERRKRRRIWPWILGLFLMLLIAVGGAAWWAYETYPEQVKTLFGWSNDYAGNGEGDAQVEIRPGDDGGDVADMLFEEGVTKTRSAFYDLLLEKKSPTFEPGTYAVHDRMSAQSALDALQDPANRVESTVAIPEGSTAKDILDIAAESTGIPLEEFQAAIEDRAALGVPKSAPNIEGWLFPATYTFQPDVDAMDIVGAMVERTKQALDDAGVAEKDREPVLTLAGLVQKESNGEDDAKVARVFLNRLEEGMRLQSDATVSYGAGGDTVLPTEAEYADRNPYNTYRRDGLPAGPISSPGDAAIAAAVNPAKGPWLFFVTVNLRTGETVFSRTDAEHERASDRLYRWLDEHPSFKK